MPSKIGYGLILKSGYQCRPPANSLTWNDGNILKPVFSPTSSVALELRLFFNAVEIIVSAFDLFLCGGEMSIRNGRIG